jgi:hypothetical protein
VGAKLNTMGMDPFQLVARIRSVVMLLLLAGGGVIVMVVLLSSLVEKCRDVEEVLGSGVTLRDTQTLE